MILRGRRLFRNRNPKQMNLDDYTSSTYYPINEDLAREAHYAAHFGTYVEGSATRNYREKVDEIYGLAETLKAGTGKGRWEEIDRLADAFSHRYADWINRMNSNKASCPSVMVSGGSNYPVDKHRRMLSREDGLWKEYESIMAIPDQMRSVAKRPLTARDSGSREKIGDSIAELEARQDYMKRANAHYRKNGTLNGFEGMGPNADSLFAEVIRIHGRPFPDYELSSNREKIKRLKKNADAIDTAVGRGSTERTFGDVTVSEDPSSMLIMIHFPYKPEADVRSVLKSNGFRWSRNNSAWQRTLNEDGRSATDRVISKLRSMGEI